MRATDHCTIEAGIHDGDLIVVDRYEQPHDDCAVVAVIDGEMSLNVRSRMMPML